MDLITLSLLKRISSLEARVEALEPANLFWGHAFSEIIPNDVTVLADGSADVLISGVTPISMKKVCPNLINGEVYTFSCDVSTTMSCNLSKPSVYLSGRAYEYDDSGDRFCVTFTYDESKDDFILYGGSTEEWVEDAEGNWSPTSIDVPVTYGHIMVNEGTKPAPWKPYKG